MRERVIGPPPSEASGKPRWLCCIDSCPLPGTYSTSTLGGPMWCFVHDGLSGSEIGEATNAILRLDPVFLLSEKLSNSAPGDSVPEHTVRALRDRGYDDAADLAAKCKTARRFAYALRSWLAAQCRPSTRATAPTIPQRMQAEGLKPISRMLP